MSFFIINFDYIGKQQIATKKRSPSQFYHNCTFHHLFPGDLETVPVSDNSPIPFGAFHFQSVNIVFDRWWCKWQWRRCGNPKITLTTIYWPWIVAWSSKNVNATCCICICVYHQPCVKAIPLWHLCQIMCASLSVIRYCVCRTNTLMLYICDAYSTTLSVVCMRQIKSAIHYILG